MTLAEFKLNTWRNSMAKGGMDSFSNYAGPKDEFWADFVILVSQNRDSEILDQSNFQCALEQLGGESKDVVVGHFGHWACGWFELLLVNPKSKKIKKAYEIHKSLQNYPVLDESDFSDRENENYSDFARATKKDLAKAISKWFEVKNSPQLVRIAYDAQMSDQYRGGEYSCLDIYECREPNHREVSDLYRALADIEHGFSKSKLYNTLLERVEKRMNELAKKKA